MKEMDEQLKTVQILVLKEFIKICEKNGLKYFALGGTALGAVRHKGFIPWDDDIDVALPREDYKKFLTVAQAQLPENMFLQTYETDKNYPNCYAKIRVNDTTFIETAVSKLDINHGVYVDIFPLDGCSASKLKRKAFRTKEKLLKAAISCAYEIPDYSAVKRFIKRKILARLIPCASAVRKLDKLYQSESYADSDIISNYNGAWGVKEQMPKEIFGNGSVAEFDGIDIVLPEKAGEYLTRLYGDYMTPPPPEKRVSHHHCTVIDLNKSYKKYIYKD